MTTEPPEPRSTRAKFVLVERTEPPGATLVFVSGEGLSLTVAHNAPGDPQGQHLARLAEHAARFLDIPCEWSVVS